MKKASIIEYKGRHRFHCLLELVNGNLDQPGIHGVVVFQRLREGTWKTAQ